MKRALPRSLLSVLVAAGIAATASSLLAVSVLAAVAPPDTSLSIPGGPTLRETTYKGCPPEGSKHKGGDPLLNDFKNRVDPAFDPRPWQVQRILHLGYSRHVNQPQNIAMAEWTLADKESIFPYEETPASTFGYVVAIDQGDGEPANCDGRAGKDWHLKIGQHPFSPDSQSVITEATPRMRARERDWNYTRLTRLLHQKVRLTGWLMLDYHHPKSVGISRGTLWEIHPITRLEVWHHQRWVRVAG